MAVKFYDFTRAMLQERLDQVKQGITLTWTDIRHFFYECRNKFLKAYPDLLEPDTKSKNLYSDWQKIIKIWCAEQGPEFDIEPDLYWRLREMMNIWPEAKATCDGASGSFLINNENRGRVSSDCSFILVCEKKTVSRELLARLQELGYELNIVATGGHTPSDVQEAVLQISESINGETPNFYCLPLHDYDLDGVKIYYKLKDRYPAVIDVGVNSEFIQYLKGRGNFDPRLVEEQNLNKNYQGELLERILQTDDYSIEDFEYLQGEPFETTTQGKTKTYYRAKRIEIDAIHVEFGIQPFVDFILDKIKRECKYWDLSRIGVGEFELEEPPNYYELAIDELEKKIEKEYQTKLNELKQPFYNIIRTAQQTQPDIEEPFWTLAKSKFEGVYKTSWGEQAFKWFQSEELDDLKETYEEDMEKQWIEDYEGELDEINKERFCYEGDVRHGELNLGIKAEKLQKRLDEAKESDTYLGGFKDSLDEIDWGKDELDKIQPPNEAELIRSVIQALETRLAELEEE